MKSLTHELWMEVPERRAIVSIHREVERLVAESGVQEGLVLVNAMHITSSVFINDDESGLHHDYEVWLEKLAPFDASPKTYRHNRPCRRGRSRRPVWSSRQWSAKPSLFAKIRRRKLVPLAS